MVRLARFDDIESVNFLREQTRNFHLENTSKIFKPFSDFDKEYTEKFLENEQNAIFVYEKDNQILGYMMIEKVIKPENLYCFERRFIHIEDFGVDKNFRQNGFGTEIFEFCKKYARENNFSKILLDVWNFNEDAIKFYQKLGFNPERTYMNFDIGD